MKTSKTKSIHQEYVDRLVLIVKKTSSLSAKLKAHTKQYREDKENLDYIEKLDRVLELMTRADDSLG